MIGEFIGAGIGDANAALPSPETSLRGFPLPPWALIGVGVLPDAPTIGLSSPLGGWVAMLSATFVASGTAQPIRIARVRLSSRVVSPSGSRSVAVAGASRTVTSSGSRSVSVPKSSRITEV